MHPPSPRITVVCLLLATLGLGGLLARPAAAADWTVQTAANQFGAARQDYRYTLNPGGRLEDGLVVGNGGGTPLRLAVRAAVSRGAGAWVHPDQDTVTVPPGGSVEVPFALSLPGDAASGDYAGEIVTSNAGQRVGIPIRLRVGGPLKPSLSVEGVGVDHSDGGVTVTYTIRNTGNAILSARQTVSVSGPFGRWAANAGKVPDSPPLLPGAGRKLSVRVRDVTPVLRTTATVTLTPLLTDAAGSTAPLPAIKASGHAWTVPWSLLLALVALVGLVVAGLALRPRLRTRASHH